MSDSEITNLRNHAIIAGYGVPGRAVAEWMSARSIPFIVIEQNQQIVNRCEPTGVTIVAGDVRDEKVLMRAGIDKADIFAIAVPIEAVVLEAVSVARKLNPTVRIIARCTYISGGMEAARRGANDTIVAEEIAAREFVRLLDGGHAAFHSTANSAR
jgi:voltage-gated potassium channel